MKLHCNEILKSFEYDEERGCWIRKEDCKSFELLEKDADDLVRISEITENCSAE